MDQSRWFAPLEKRSFCNAHRRRLCTRRLCTGVRNRHGCAQRVPTNSVLGEFSTNFRYLIPFPAGVRLDRDLHHCLQDHQAKRVWVAGVATLALVITGSICLIYTFITSLAAWGALERSALEPGLGMLSLPIFFVSLRLQLQLEK